MSEDQGWIQCPRPVVGDTLRWGEPLWAKPSKPRGRRDKIGEQQVTATLVLIGDLLELKVISVRKLSGDDAVLIVKKGDNIRRRKASLDQGECLKRLNVSNENR